MDGLLQKDKLTVTFGPWFGELGHELYKYNCYLRGYFAQNKFLKVIALCRKGRGILYEDFADEVVELECSGEISCRHKCRSIKEPEIKNAQDALNKIKPDYHIYTKGSYFINYANQINLPPLKNISPMFNILGEVKEDLKYDFVVHARNLIKEPRKGYKLDTLRNWELEKWNQLISKFDNLKIACVGSLESSLIVEGCDDHRGKDLKFLADILRSSGLIVGPSSGPMHFASLCDCALAVWDNCKSQRRYTKSWNPFRSKVHYYNNTPLENDPYKPAYYKKKTFTHSPPVDNIYDLVKGALDDK